MLPLYHQITVEAFERQWRTIHDAIFSGRPADEQPFLNGDWETLLIPYGLNMDPDVFDALGRAARQVGDNSIVIWNSEALDPQPAAWIPWSYEALDQVRGTLLGHFETHLFGHSGRWGVVCSVHDFSCLGSDRSFVEAVTSTLGGREGMRQRFMRFASEEWQVGEKFRATVLRLIGSE